ncbi:MAG: PKD domain-containing protein [Bacteroidetes bacterium]|nr:PKD domain-containing protein [Bacteroidota bacterium]
MKKVILMAIAVLFPFGLSYSQAFLDDFESYTVGDYLANSSSLWTTWNNSPGSSEDCYIVNDKFYSDSNSIYFYSSSGGGPQDVVLPFGKVHNSGLFGFDCMFYIPNSSTAYFNFQAAATTGVTWAIEVNFNSNATFNAGSYFTSSYPQDQWFHLEVVIDLDSNDWEFFIDGVSAGSFSNSVNAVSYLDIFPAQAGEYWIDDVGFCVNLECYPELALSDLKLTPSSTCSGHTSDVSLVVKNNGPKVAKSMILGLDMAGQNRTLINIDLDSLAVGDSTTLTLNNAFTTRAIGTNLVVSAINVQQDIDASNDTATATIDVLRSPKSTIAKGSVFNGQYKKGIASDPDITVVDKMIQYTFSAPQGYSNSGYNTDWKIASVTATSAKGNNISSFWNITAPTSTVDGYVSITPTSGYLDSLISICIVVEDLKSGCDSSMCRSIIIAPTPKPNFKFTTPVCDGTPVQFTNLSTIHSGSMLYKWYFDDGDSVDYLNPVHTFPAPGTYCVKLVTKSYVYSITSDTTICVTISENPVANFKVDNACQGNEVIFTDSSTVNGATLTYDWDFGDSSTHSTSKNPRHEYAKNGGYTVTLVIRSSNGCTDKQARNAFQFPSPVANFNYNDSCSNDEIQFSDISKISSGKLGRRWNFYDGSQETDWTLKHVFTTPGKNSVTLYSISPFGCVDSITKVLDIVPGPLTDFTFGQVCDAKPTAFMNTTTEPDGVNVTYNWQFGDGAYSTDESPSHKFKDLKKYTVKLTAQGDNGCSSSIEKDVTVIIQPIVDLSAQNVCEGDSVKFENNTNERNLDVTYFWTFGDGDTSRLISPTKLYNISETTIFGVTLKASVEGGCTDSKTISVRVSETPDCGFTTTQVGGPKLTFIFHADSSEYPFYLWQFDEEGTANGSDPTFTFDEEGTYKISLLARSADGCECLDSSQSLVVKKSNIEDVFGNSVFNVKPNPSAGSFTISFNNADNQDEVNIQLHDAVGRLVYSKNTFRSTDNLIRLDAGHLNAGMYYLTVTNHGVRATQPVQIQH